MFLTADFQFVAVRIFEKAGIIAGTVLAAKLGPFNVTGADLVRELSHPINFFTRLGPKSDSCAVRLMLSILLEREKRRRLVAADRIKRAAPRVGSIASKSKRRSKSPVKLACACDPFHSKINVIQNSCFHFNALSPPCCRTCASS